MPVVTAKLSRTATDRTGRSEVHIGFMIDASVIRAHQDQDTGAACGRSIIAADPSSGTGRGDDFVRLDAHWADRGDGTKVLVVGSVKLEQGRFAYRKGGAEVLRELAVDAKRVGAELVATDQGEKLLMLTELPRHGLKVQVFPHTPESKAAAVERLQLLLSQGQLSLPQKNGGRIRKQLLDYQQTTTPNGLKRFASRQSAPGGDDIVSALLTLMMADAAGLLEGSPFSKPAKPKYNPPRTSLRLEFASDGPNGNASSSIFDRLEVDQRTGRVIVRRRPRGTFEGGGF